MLGVPIRMNKNADVRLITQIEKWNDRPDAFSYYKPSRSCAHGRNQIIRYAILKVREVSDIMFFDSDSVPPPETLDVLLSHDKDIVTAVQPLFLASRGGIVWNVMDYTDKPVHSFDPIAFDGLPNKLFRVSTCGFGAVLVKRRVFEKMGWPYFKDIYTQHRWAVGEDSYFAAKAQECGFEIWADPNLQCEHNKNVNLLELANTVYGSRKRINELAPSLYLEQKVDKKELSLIKEAKVTSRGFTTHLPILASVISHTSGPVLELGCGFGSTPLLHQMCLSQKRELVSCDSSAKWIDALSRYGNNGHRLLSVDDWDKCEVFDSNWDVVFIDHEPITQRVKDLKRLKDKASYIVIHDSGDPIYGYERILKDFKYRHDYKYLRPWTTVVSNFNSLDFLGEHNVITEKNIADNGYATALRDG